MKSEPREIRAYLTAPEVQGGEVDLADLLSVLIGNRWLIALTTFLFLLLGGLMEE